MNLALIYDRINKLGGAERVLLALHHLWPQAPLFTGVYNPSTASWAKDFDIRPSFVNRLPAARLNHEWYFWLMPLAFETFDFSGYDTVLSVCSDFTKGAITRPEQLHVSYILSPTRYLWLNPQEYQLWAKLPLMPFVLNQLRYWDYIAAQRPDVILTISQHAQRQIHKIYHRDAKIIYPPVDTDFFKPKVYPAKPWRSGAAYYLIVSRLVPYKQIDLAIKAFNQLKLPLKIIGTGRSLAYLKHLAHPNIEFLGQLTDRQVLSYYQGCRALIFPGVESFGLTMVEAQACGKPVIAQRQGGAGEIIIHGQTGILFNQPKPKALAQAVREFESGRFDWQDCRRNSDRFSLHKFTHQFKSTLNQLWLKHQTQH